MMTCRTCTDEGFITLRTGGVDACPTCTARARCEWERHVREQVQPQPELPFNVVPLRSAA